MDELIKEKITLLVKLLTTQSLGWEYLWSYFDVKIFEITFELLNISQIKLSEEKLWNVRFCGEN